MCQRATVERQADAHPEAAKLCFVVRAKAHVVRAKAHVVRAKTRQLIARNSDD